MTSVPLPLFLCHRIHTMKDAVRDTDLGPSRQPQRVQVIERAFGLLDDLVQFDGSATAGQLKEASGLAGPTVHRLLHTLMALGWSTSFQTRDTPWAPTSSHSVKVQHVS